MDNFPELMQTLSKRITKMKDSILTEEATKTSVIMPFFQLLNYDVFNPEEFLPEFIADVGIKKGEKVDYAILQQGKPIILIEAKSIQEPLTKHDSQLFRYFGTTEAKFAILTNGVIYRFYTDLEQQNKMDSAPFFEFNLFDIREHDLIELYKFRKENFSVESILTTASELKYTNEIKQFLTKQWDEPSEDFVTFIVNHIYSGKKTKQVIDRFNSLVKTSLKQFLSDQVNDKLKAALSNSYSEPLLQLESQQQKEVSVASLKGNVTSPQIVTTEEELEGFVLSRILLRDVISSERVFYRDNLTYFNIIVDNSIRKWICRLGFNTTSKYIQFNDENKTMVAIESPYDIEKHKEKLIEVARKFI